MATYQKKLQQCKDRSDDIAALVAAGQKPKAPLTPPTLPLLPKLPAPDKDLKELSPTELMAMEKDAVGLYISSHPLYAYAKEIMKKTTAHSASLIDHRDREEVLVIGIVSNLIRRTTKNGNKMATFDLEDLHGYVPVTVFHRTLEECSSLIAEGNVVLMRGKVEAHEDTGRKLIAQELVRLPPKDVQQAPKVAEIVIKNPDLSLIEKLKTIASTHPGDERVQVKLVFEGQSLALVSPLSLSPEGWDAVRLVSVKK
jgi:DNA polymerase-3 subunit alpha